MPTWLTTSIPSTIERDVTATSEGSVQSSSKRPTKRAGSVSTKSWELHGQRGVCPCGVCKLNTITRVADAVRDVPRRRKMLFYLGSSLPGLTTSFGCFAAIRQAREALLHAAGVANLAIPTFDTNLLETLAPTARRPDAPLLDRRALVAAHLERQGNMMP